MPDFPFDPEDFAIAITEYGSKKGEEARQIHLRLLRGTPEYLQRVLDRAGLASFEELAALPAPELQLPALYGARDVSTLIDWLESSPASQQASLVRVDTRLHRNAAVAELLDRCRSRWSSEPERALPLSKLALSLIERVPDQDELSLFVGEKPDLLSRAWAYQGNVHRLLGDLRQAETCFARATRALQECWLDEGIEAEVLRLKAGFLRAQRRIPAAREAIDRAIQIYDELGDAPALAKALLVRVSLRCTAGEWEAGLRDLDRAEPLLDSANHPVLGLSAMSGRLWLLHLAGQDRTAQVLLARAEKLAQEVGRPTDRLRILWCKAQIHQGLGLTPDAEVFYNQVRSGFFLAKSAYDVALVSLELAALYLEQSRWSEIRELAAEAIPLFEARDIHREALAAWRLFAEAARKEALEQETVEQLRVYLEKARLDPSYCYSP
jgi:tetratricopeptide (TPR) repeat protein